MTRAQVDEMPLEELASLINQVAAHEMNPAAWWKGPLWFETDGPPGDVWEISG